MARGTSWNVVELRIFNDDLGIVILYELDSSWNRNEQDIPTYLLRTYL